jgi:hypothetical protein
LPAKSTKALGLFFVCSFRRVPNPAANRSAFKVLDLNFLKNRHILQTGVKPSATDSVHAGINNHLKAK